MNIFRLNLANLESILNPETRIQSWHSAVNILLRSGILLLVSWYPGAQVSWCPCIVVSRYPGVQVSWFPGILVSRYPGVQVSWCPGILVSRNSGVQGSWCPGILVSRDPGVQGSWCPGILVSRYPGARGQVCKVPCRYLVQPSDITKVGQYKRRTHKRRTGTNLGLVQTSDQHKRRTSTNVAPAQTSDGYICKEKRRTLNKFEKRPLL